MLLKVGELARRAGVTVRALHHYDSIGLLRPSGRSDGGYRLYDRDDVARLHGIQTLRQMGVPLAEVARLLEGGALTLQALLQRQVQVLDQQIARGQALRERLDLMQRVLARGGQPGIDDWLASLATMATLERYFSVQELQQALQRLRQCAADWPPLVQAFRTSMDSGVPPEAVEVQPLLQQWFDVVTRWMDGDFDLLERWGTMLREQPGLPLPFGLDPPLLDHIGRALQHRLAVTARHVPQDVLQRLRQLRLRWRALAGQVQRLVDAGVPPGDPAARAQAQAWQRLLDDTFGGDAALRDRVIAAYEHEPVLRAGAPLTPALRRYLEQAAGP